MDLRSISSNQITIWVVLALGLIVALMIGSAVGTSDLRFVIGALALIPSAIIFIKLKTNIWVLLPFSFLLTGRLPWLPLPLSVRDLCFLAVISAFTVFALTRAIPLKRKLSTLDYIIYINLAYLVTVFVRNPVGVLTMQTSMVGGRPYFEIALAFGAFLILSRVQVTDFIAKVFPLFFLVPAGIIGALDAIARSNHQLGYLLNSIYSGVGESGTFGPNQTQAEFGQTRLLGLQAFGSTCVLFVCAKYNPITCFSPLYPWRVFMLAIGFGAIFLSGYRNLIIYAAMACVLSTVLRGRRQDLLTLFAAGGLVVVSLILLQGNIIQLPYTMQRTLSWLPGEWDPDVTTDAQGSTDWRIEMWEWAWNDELVLRDKVWGQGFGFTIEDMNLIANSLAGGGSGSTLLGGSDREQFMITGTFHNGPISSIKFVGTVGFVLYYGLMCYMAVLAWRVCKRAYGTKGFTFALFVCIPIIYEPFNFVVVYGALDGSYPALLFRAGLLHMVQQYVEKLKLGIYSEIESRVKVPATPSHELQRIFTRQPL